MGIQCLGGELPFFFLSGWILKRIGHVHCMSIVLLGIGVRYTLYSFLLNPWWVLPIELMNGVTFGLFYATMASYASIVAPPGTEATIQVRFFFVQIVPPFLYVHNCYYFLLLLIIVLTNLYFLTWFDFLFRNKYTTQSF